MTALRFVASAVFLSAIAGHVIGCGLSWLPAVKRWLATHYWRGRRLRIFFPHWGLFAQRFGMFEIDIYGRTIGGEAGQSGTWQCYTEPEHPWHAPIWRPGIRNDGVGRALAYMLIGASAQRGNADVIHDAAYQRIVAYGRRFHQRMSPGYERFQFCIVLSRGFWSIDEPKAIYMSPVESRRISGAERTRNESGDVGE